MQRKSRRGKIFYSCSTYPKCDYAIWNKPLSEPCPRCAWPVITIKTTKSKGTEKVCPQKDCYFFRTLRRDGRGLAFFSTKRWRSMQSPVSAKQILNEIFGYSEFRNHQAQIIDALVAGRDILTLMPTGGGKSLCYQIPSLLRAGTGIVISPLIALMQDQVDALNQLGIRAAFLNSTLDAVSAARDRTATAAG